MSSLAHMKYFSEIWLNLVDDILVEKFDEEYD